MEVRMPACAGIPHCNPLHPRRIYSWRFAPAPIFIIVFPAIDGVDRIVIS
jgi:hypothetical protein